jgi:serine/threonine-protein kinase RsbW/sigma-B regulation protein RsbU (phosphoserine phosphatase)
MTTDDERTWPARMERLAEATAFVESFCESHGLARADALRLTLVLEELFTNTVRHGHGGNCDAPVRIALSAAPGHVDLEYEDTAPPFDPVAHLASMACELEAAPDDRPVGRVGIALVLQMAVRARYVRDDGRNRLYLTIPR